MGYVCLVRRWICHTHIHFFTGSYRKKLVVLRSSVVLPKKRRRKEERQVLTKFTFEIDIDKVLDQGLYANVSPFRLFSRGNFQVVSVGIVFFFKKRYIKVA